jgi:hypothetical protein
MPPLLLAAVMIAGAATFATAANAGTCPPGNNGGNYCNRIPTSLTATPVIPEGVSATLVRSDTLAPLPGQTLTFTAGGSVLCTAVTDSSGKAGCTSVIAVLTALLNLGYKVTYAGTAVYAPSSATGSAIALGSLIVGAPQGPARDAADRHAWLKARLHAIGRARLVHELRVLRARDARRHHKHAKTA